jgi:hypothetical protein
LRGLISAPGTGQGWAFPVNLTQTAANFRMRVIGLEGNDGNNYSTQRDFCGARAEEQVHSSGLCRRADTLHGVRDLLVLRCFATTNVEAGAGPFVRRRPNCPRLMSSFSLSFLPPDKGVRGCLLHP